MGTTRKNLVRGVGAGVVLAAIIELAPSSTSSLSCSFPSPQHAISEADVIFIGTLTRITDTPFTVPVLAPGPTSTIRVSRVWKGELTRVKEIIHDETYGTFNNSDLGKEFVFFAHQHLGGLYVGMCPWIVDADRTGHWLAVLGPDGRDTSDLSDVLGWGVWVLLFSAVFLMCLRSLRRISAR